MRKIFVLTEGPSEERFVKQVLNPHFQAKGVYLQPVIVATKRVSTGGKFKGGVPSYEKLRKEILRLFQLETRLAKRGALRRFTGF